MQSFAPPARILMGPGPSDVDPRVLQAMARPTVGHLDPRFQELMEEIKALLRYALRTENPLTFPISGPGSAAMEAAIVNVVEPGNEVIVAKNGVFGERLRENVERAGGVAHVVEFEWGKPVDPEAIRMAFRDHPQAIALAVVHAETSTGVKSDVAALARIAHDAGALIIVDAVTALGGIDLATDDWGLDVVYAGTQKCLSAPPGLAPISFSPRAVARVKARKTKVQSWLLDLTLVMGYWDGAGGRSYHHTAPVNALYGLHEALLMLKEEGLEASIARHLTMHERLRRGLEAMGLDLFVAEAARLPQLNAVSVPSGIDEAKVRSMLLDRFGLEIGAGLGALAGKVWRIGLMGQSANLRNVTLCLSALERALSAMQAPITEGVALAAALAD